MTPKMDWKDWLLCAVLLPPMFAGAMWVLGTTIDVFAENSERHDRCLKQAATGYDIRQCR